MFDLATSTVSHDLIAEFRSKNKILSAVCHGPAAFAYAKDKSGNFIVAGEEVTGFSNSEEDGAQLSSVMPFMLEDQLNAASGGKFVKADKDWGPKVVSARGGKLITGQNPASATGVGEAIYESLFGKKA